MPAAAAPFNADSGILDDEERLQSMKEISVTPGYEVEVEFMRRHRPQPLLQGLIRPEEIARTVDDLATLPALATAGGALRVDGGCADAILP